MKNVFVYCEVNEERTIADVSLELLSKGHKLAQQLGVKLEAVVLGDGIEDLAPLIMPFGADVIHLADSPGLYPYRTLPHAAVVEHIFRQEKPEIALFGASPVGRDLAPRIASALRCGLTADCTSLEIGDHHEKKTETTYKDLLYQIRRQPGAQSSENNQLPSGLQIGTGVRVVGTQKEFTEGSLQVTGNSLDVAINGRGFLEVLLPD
ncbi:MAG TPA: hypothetical protein P5248_11100, partial [Bacteroidales bacterium]|nr:hypothetical protein [Bacteroidales bacterium]